MSDEWRKRTKRWVVLLLLIALALALGICIRKAPSPGPESGWIVLLYLLAMSGVVTAAIGQLARLCPIRITPLAWATLWALTAVAIFIWVWWECYDIARGTIAP
jgi:hypothetical protein